MITQIIELEDGEAGVVLPLEVLAKLGLREGDTIIAETALGVLKLRRPGADELERE